MMHVKFWVFIQLTHGSKEQRQMSSELFVYFWSLHNISRAKTKRRHSNECDTNQKGKVLRKI